MTWIMSSTHVPPDMSLLSDMLLTPSIARQAVLVPPRAPSCPPALTLQPPAPALTPAVQAVSLNWIIKTLNSVSGKTTNIIVLDACRINEVTPAPAPAYPNK